MGFRIGRGSKVSLGLSSGSPATWAFTQLNGIDEFEIPTLEADEVEVTNISSPGKSREYIAGLEDSGEVTFSIFWDEGSATANVISTATASRENVRLKFEIGNTHVETWNAFIKSSKLNISDDEAIVQEVVFRVSARVAE